jgi:mutator protein MutT
MSNLKNELQNFKPLFTLGAQVIIFNEKQEVLLCHRRDKDFWNFPGGTVEKDETPQETAVREAKEEVGVEVEIYKFLGVYVKPEQNDVVFSFLARITSGKLTLTDEADEIAYFSVNSLPSKISPLQSERIKDALQESNQVIFKKQYSY